MTLQELSKYYKLRGQLQQDMEILESLKAKAAPGAAALTGMPHATGVNDKVAFLAVEIADLENSIDVLQVAAAEEKKKLEAYIATIEDNRIRIIFRLRFLRCLSWKEVADYMGWSYNVGSVKGIAYKWLKATGSDQ